MLRSRHLRWLAAFCTALVAVSLLGVQCAAAAPEPGTASLTSVQLHDGTFTGVLTVRANGAPVAVDPASLKAIVAGQTYPVTTTPVAQLRRATMLVVDTSGSMGETGMATVRAAVAAFLREVPPDVSVGLVSFAATAGVDVAPTKDHAKVQRAVNALRARGETTLYDAVAVASSALAPYEERSILLLSDGGDTASTKATRSSATAILKSSSVRAEVIGFKTEDSDNSVLQGFAKVGNGSVAAAGNADAVRAAFERAAKVLDSQSRFTFTPDSSVQSVESVTIIGSANGWAFQVRSVADFGGKPTPTTTPTGAPTTDDADRSTVIPPAKQEGLPPQLLIALIATGLGIFGVAGALAAPLFRSDRRRRVEGVERYVSGGASMVAEKAGSVTPQALSAGLVQLGDKVMEGRESTNKTMALIERADLPLRAGEWWVLRLVSAVIGIALSLMFFGGGLLATVFALVVGAVVGYFLPSWVLRFLAKRRCKKFEAQLPDVLMLVASSLSTGFSLLQALDAVAKDAAQPAAKEFSRALAETRIGADVSDSLERVAVRMDSDNMKWATMAIQIQRTVGGNLAETLQTTAKTLREREALQRHVKALSAEGKLSAYILIALPIGIFLFTAKTNREYVQLLWTDPMGWGMLAGGIISLGIGIFWMRKVVEVKV
ncbi:tight adherence protein B [Pedococcus cremeus]|uniref:Tight adherence protein B n=1 Tax=Pedococcus cremeus TaxID=587636 RepID=A0A1H9XCD0_9MICO|nr:VWA domain-containing protein [Pedococcus cremeus]SES43782.1 tight adherence protein B [Pedococcus cremeus]